MAAATSSASKPKARAAGAAASSLPPYVAQWLAAHLVDGDAALAIHVAEHLGIRSGVQLGLLTLDALAKVQGPAVTDGFRKRFLQVVVDARVTRSLPQDPADSPTAAAATAAAGADAAARAKRQRNPAAAAVAAGAADGNGNDHDGDGKDAKPASAAASAAEADGDDGDAGSVAAHRMIAMFCHKGGVGKTTTTIQLALSLTALNKRVLLIDADTQCNLTAFFMTDETLKEEDQGAGDEPDIVEGGTDDVGAVDADDDGDVDASDAVVAASQMRRADTPYDAKKLVVQLGDTLDAENDSAKRNRMIPINKRQAGMEKNSLFALLDTHSRAGSSLKELTQLLDQSDMQPTVVRKAGSVSVRSRPLLLIPGSAKLSLLENGMRSGMSGYASKVGGFRFMVNHLAVKHRIDVVLVDLGPGTNWLNEVFVMSCDYILPCVFPDYFSVASVDMMLRHVLPKWMRDQQQLANAPAVKDRSTFNAHPPRLLSFLVTNFRKHDSVVTNAPSRWIKTLRGLTQADHVPSTRHLKTQDLPVGDITAAVKQLYLPLDKHSGMAIAFVQHFTGPIVDRMQNEKKGLCEFVQEPDAVQLLGDEGKRTGGTGGTDQEPKPPVELTCMRRYKALAHAVMRLPAGGLGPIGDEYEATVLEPMAEVLNAVAANRSRRRRRARQQSKILGKRPKAATVRAAAAAAAAADIGSDGEAPATNAGAKNRAKGKGKAKGKTGRTGGSKRKPHADSDSDAEESNKKPRR